MNTHLTTLIFGIKSLSNVDYNYKSVQRQYRIFLIFKSFLLFCHHFFLLVYAVNWTTALFTFLNCFDGKTLTLEEKERNPRQKVKYTFNSRQKRVKSVCSDSNMIINFLHS